MNNELYHHGILGQRWGHRNGPPYPLGSSVSTGKSLRKKTREEKKASKEVVKSARRIRKHIEGEKRINSSSSEAAKYAELENVVSSNPQKARQALKKMAHMHGMSAKDYAKYHEKDAKRSLEYASEVEDDIKGLKADYKRFKKNGWTDNIDRMFYDANDFEDELDYLNKEKARYISEAKKSQKYADIINEPSAFISKLRKRR